MHFIYAPRDPNMTPMDMRGYERWNANKNWAKHQYNLVTLTHIAKETKDLREKQQAEAEMLMAESRKTWWSRHPNFTMSGAIADLKSEYGIDHVVSQQ